MFAISIVENWKKSVLTFNDLILRDAKKEFNAVSKTGFGLDGDETDKQLDFESVRGTYEENSFVKDINTQLNKTIEIANTLTKKLNQIKS